MKRTYIKHGIWHLGGTKKPKGGFLPSLGALARPLLVSAGGDVGGEVLKGLAKKFRVGRGGEKKRIWKKKAKGKNV